RSRCDVLVSGLSPNQSLGAVAKPIFGLTIGTVVSSRREGNPDIPLGHNGPRRRTAAPPGSEGASRLWATTPVPAGPTLTCGAGRGAVAMRRQQRKGSSAG